MRFASYSLVERFNRQLKVPFFYSGKDQRKEILRMGPASNTKLKDLKATNAEMVYGMPLRLPIRRFLHRSTEKQSEQVDFVNIWTNSN